MRRTGLLFALLLPLVAAAEWRSLGTFGGTPDDVQVVDGGLVVVVSNGTGGGVTLWRFDEASTTLTETVPGTFIGGGVLPSGCPFGVTGNGVMTGGAACPGGHTLAITGNTWVRLRPLSPDGTGVALTNSTSFDTLQVGRIIDGGAWTSRGTNFVSSTARSLHTVSVGDAHLAVFSTGAPNSLRLSVDAGAFFQLDAGASLGLREAVPFERTGRVAVLGHGPSQLRLVPDVAGPEVLTVSIPGGVTPVFVAASGNLGLVSLTDGRLLVPVPSPAEPQLTWVVREDFPGTGAHRVHCADGRRCAVTTDGGQAWLYENREAPSLSVPGLGLVDAGSTLRLVADAGDPDLDPVFVSWSADGGAISTVSADGTSVELVVTPGVCSGAVVASVTDGWPAFDRSVTVPFTVFDRGALSFDASTTMATAGDAPIDFSVTHDGGCQAPSSFSWSSSDGQSGSGSRFSYVVPATECAARQVTITTTTNWPVGTPLSTTHDTTIALAPRFDPLNASTPFEFSAFGDAGVLFGSLDAGVTCLEQRLVSAEIVVSQGGAPVANTSASVPGDWSLAVPGSCSGGRYEIEARLLEDGGFTGASVTTELTLPQLAVALGPLNVGRIDAQCGVGASAEVALEPVPGACAAAEYSWRSMSGPALETPAGTGAALSVQTAARDFSSVGQPIVLEFAADAGFGNTALSTRTIDVGVQPFLEVSWKATPPLRREEEPVTFELTLRNPTECAVSGLSVTIPLSNATALLDTVLVDGARATAQATGDGVFLGDVSVPASGQTRIKLSARPRLLGGASIAPLVSLQGYVVSIAPGDAAPATGCGCTSLPPTSVIVLALGLLVLRRRRRGSR